VQPTHVLFGPQYGVPPVHAVVCVESHCTQEPALAPDVSHTPFAPVQSAAVHARHVSVDVSQMGVFPVHAALLLAVHCTHSPARLPVVSHAGVAPEQSPALQARHVWLVASQMGVLGVAVQPALLMQATGGPCTTQSFCALDHSVCS
jgi:hypothetical protein